MSEPGAPEQTGETKGWLDHALLATGPLLLAAFAVFLVLLLRGDTPWGEVVGVLLASAAVGAVLARTLAGLRAAVPVLTLGLLAGLVLIGGVLDRDEWLGLFFVGYPAGGILVPVDKARRDARRRA